MSIRMLMLVSFFAYITQSCFAQDNSEQRRRLASHPATPAAMFAQLAADTDWRVICLQ